MKVLFQTRTNLYSTPGGDLIQIKKTKEYLEEHFNKSGLHYYNIVRGIHNSPVKPNRIAKSVAAEHTFNENLTSEIFMEEKLQRIANELEKRLKRYNISGKTVTLKIKYSDFTMQTRSKTLPYFIADKGLLFETAKELLYQEKMKESVNQLDSIKYGAFLRYIDRESHSDQTNISDVKEIDVSLFKEAFKQIFEESGNIKHYTKMMYE